MERDNHRGVAVGYIYFSRAFDSVLHNKLLVELASYGVAINMFAFVKDFLADNTQHAVVDGAISSIRKVLSGVTQGCVLGHILFILYINDVADSLPTSTICKMFADHLNIYSVLNIINDANSILSAFDTIKQLASIWQLQINESSQTGFLLGEPRRHLIMLILHQTIMLCRLFLALRTLAFLYTVILVLENILMT